MRTFNLFMALFAVQGCLFPSTSNATTPETPIQSPNIIWISCEDISPHLGCYGDKNAITPNIDELATNSIRYQNAFTTAGVCAPCRSAIITGIYQSTLGTHHMRCNAKLPKDVKPFPVYLKKAGYYCTNNSKQDYQFKTPSNVWDESNKKAHWKNRPDPKQPFSQFSILLDVTKAEFQASPNTNKSRKTSHRSNARMPPQLTLPPYYPDTPIVREDWKRNYELITAMDAWAGKHEFKN